MNCPYCGGNQVRVVNSRPTGRDTQIWRRRSCSFCGEFFTTYEKINLSQLVVIKRSGEKQRFNRAKLFSGIYHSAIYKKDADRGDMSILADELTEQVEKSILLLKKKEIETRKIKEIAYIVLSKKEPDIFLRFVAYRDGMNRKEMKRVLEKAFFRFRG